MNRFAGGRIWPPFSLVDCLGCSWRDLYKQAFAARQYVLLGISNNGLGPMFAALARYDAPLDAKAHAARNRKTELDLHLCRNRQAAHGADGFAHRLVKERSDDAAMQEAGMALKCFGNLWQAHDRAVLSNHEFQPQSNWIGGTTSKTAVVGRVCERIERFINVKLHEVSIPVGIRAMACMTELLARE